MSLHPTHLQARPFDHALSTRVPVASDRHVAVELLRTQITAVIPAPHRTWFDEQWLLATTNPTVEATDLAFGLAARKFGKLPLGADETTARIMARRIPDWPIDTLALDEAVRMLLLAASDNTALTSQRISRLLRHADVAEQLAVYKGLPLYSHSEELDREVTRGLRSNVQEVFEAIAHRNPYTSWHLDDLHWNQLILKALFIGCELHPVVGLAQRASSALSDMLVDYAGERFSAGRSISGELWPLVAPYASYEQLERFLPLLDMPGEQCALLAALAPHGSRFPAGYRQRMGVLTSGTESLILSNAVESEAVAGKPGRRTGT